MTTSFYTYIVRCKDDSLYTGWTLDLDHRIAAHNGEVPGGAKYTKPRRPVTLVWYCEHATKQEAQAQEYRIKQLSRKQKEAFMHREGTLVSAEG